MCSSRRRRDARLPAEAREVFDVSGAGDTVVAVLGAALGRRRHARSRRRSWRTPPPASSSARSAPRSFTPTSSRRRCIDRDALEQRKVLPLALALDHVARWRRNGLKVGFTNGCFDLLHPGHVSLLRQARAACDRLVVGLNSDASVAAPQGPGPAGAERGARAPPCWPRSPPVDLVVVFDEDTPSRSSRRCGPTLLVKGADYSLDQVVGGDSSKPMAARSCSPSSCPATAPPRPSPASVLEASRIGPAHAAAAAAVDPDAMVPRKRKRTRQGIRKRTTSIRGIASRDPAVSPALG